MRTAAVNALRNAFKAELPAGLLHENAQAVVGHQQAPIDFAIGTGHLVQLAHGWSFQVQDPSAIVQQIKAWSWTLRDVREHSGRIHVPGRDADYDVPREVSVDVAYVPPESDEGLRSLEEALEVFAHLEVRAVEADNARVVAVEAREALSD